MFIFPLWLHCCVGAGGTGGGGGVIPPGPTRLGRSEAAAAAPAVAHGVVFVSKRSAAGGQPFGSSPDSR